MSAGRPDFHPTMLLEGKYGTDLIPILTDALGQLYTVMSGYYGGVPTPILLDSAGRILAHLVGKYGGSIIDVTVNSAGELIIQMKGNDGGTLRTVAVDANGIILSRMKGSDGGTLRDVAVDGDGNMIAVMKGDFSGVLKTVAVDTNGIMKANLSAQDLNYLKVRPVYGRLQGTGYSTKAVANGATETLLSVSGIGALVGGYIYLYVGSSASAWDLIIKTDGVTAWQETTTNLFQRLNILGQGVPVGVNCYNDIEGFYVLAINPGVTFESALLVQIYNNTGASRNFVYSLNYALVP